MRLLKNGEAVIGVDNLNNYYDRNLKKKRLFNIEQCNIKCKGKWNFHKISIENNDDLQNISNNYNIKLLFI
tara:strand:- start:225 stop:437 length:213 start_codon:yes stop_codon:yes gene_type:complete